MKSQRIDQGRDLFIDIGGERRRREGGTTAWPLIMAVTEAFSKARSASAVSWANSPAPLRRSRSTASVSTGAVDKVCPSFMVVVRLGGLD